MAQDAWMETCLIAIAKEGGSDVQFAGLTETVDFDIGDKDVEGVALVNGGRVMKWNPQADTTITFEAYPLQVGTASGTTGTGFFDLMSTADATQPIRLTNDHTRNKYRVLCLWTEDTTATTGQSATASGSASMRLGFANVHFTSVKPSFTDGILKYTITGKCGAFDKSNSANLMMESCTGSTDVLPAIAAYTSSNKFG